MATRGLLGLVVDLLRGGTEIPIGALFTGLFDNDLRSALLAVDPEECGDLFAVADDWYARHRLPGRAAGLARPPGLVAVGVGLRPPAAAGPADGRLPRRPRLIWLPTSLDRQLVFSPC